MEERVNEAHLLCITPPQVSSPSLAGTPHCRVMSPQYCTVQPEAWEKKQHGQCVLHSFGKKTQKIKPVDLCILSLPPKRQYKPELSNLNKIHVYLSKHIAHFSRNTVCSCCMSGGYLKYYTCHKLLLCSSFSACSYYFQFNYPLSCNWKTGNSKDSNLALIVPSYYFC